MGDRYFFVVSMTRMAAEESLMLVTDNKGHVVHATQVRFSLVGAAWSLSYRLA
jgi:hypothetical protein